jgi:hypothetical protein
MKTLAAVVLGVLVAGCATPAPSSTPVHSALPTSAPTPIATPSPSRKSSIAFVCLPITSGPAVASPAPAHCSDSDEGAVLRAVAGLGYPVKTVTIGPFNAFAVPPAGWSLP